MEDFDKLFRENAQKIISDFKRDFPFLKARKDYSLALKNIHRYAHSLKGLSAMMKLKEVYSLSEELESILSKIIKGALNLNDKALLKIENGFNRIEKMIKNGAQEENPFS
jgi:chemotaxis protein histidine kinase CheA